jgi:hypothetical protein
MYLHRLHAVLVVLCLAGCASAPTSKDAMLTYQTQPEGAELFEAGKSLGMAPVTRSYKHDGSSVSIRTPEVTAVWPSGAKEGFYTLLAPGADQVATIERPKGAPNLQADLDHAKQVATARERDAARAKEATARDMARNSQRCKDQMAKGNLATNDC